MRSWGLVGRWGWGEADRGDEPRGSLAGSLVLRLEGDELVQRRLVEPLGGLVGDEQRLVVGEAGGVAFAGSWVHLTIII